MQNRTVILTLSSVQKILKVYEKITLFSNTLGLRVRRFGLMSSSHFDILSNKNPPLKPF